MPENASARLVPKLVHLAARRFSAHRVVGRILPTEWERAPLELEWLYQREHPRLALHFGVSERAKGFVIETLAKNKRKSLPDARGALPPSQRMADAPSQLRVALPTAEIVERLSGLGMPAELSSDAGTYICNALLFRSLELAVEAPEPPLVGFVHIPHVIPQPKAASTAAPLDFERALLGGLEIIRTALGRPPSRRASATS